MSHSAKAVLQHLSTLTIVLSVDEVPGEPVIRPQARTLWLAMKATRKQAAFLRTHFPFF